MDSYNFHFERMNNLDLHPLGLPVNRLSAAKSGGSIDQFTHHHHHRHGKGDSAYSSFSGGSTAPDYPSPFLPEDLQGGSLHYTDLKYVKAVYHPHQLLPSDARSMDQLYRSVEAISKQYRHSSSDNNNKENNNSSSNGFLANPYPDQEKAPPAAPPMPPPPPARLDSFIATRNLENSRAHHHGPEGQGPGQLPASRALAANPEAGGLRADSVYDPVYARRSSQPLLRDPLNPDRTDKSTNVLSRSPPRGTSQPENLKHKQPAAGNDSGGSHFEGHRKRAHSAHGCLVPDPTRSGSPRRASQNLINGSIKHKGQFYFVTGVLNPPESAPKNISPCASEAGSESSTVVETHRLVEREKERGTERERPPPPYVASDHLFWKDPRLRHQGGLDAAADEREYLAKTRSREDEGHGLAAAHSANPRVSRSFDALEPSHKSASRDIGRSHCSNHPIFYCGPEENSIPPLCTLTHPSPDAETAPPPAATAQANQHKREDQGRRGRRQLLGDVASEKISKEATPLLYHLTGASRAVAPKPKRDVDDVGANGKETGRGCRDDRPSQGDAPEEEEDGRHACNTLDDSFKKYYKEKLKDAQSKVLRETSFKRRDLQLSWPHRIRPRPEPRPSVLPPSVCPPQDPQAPPADAPAPSLSSSEGAPRAGAKGEEEEAKGEERENEERESETNGRPANVAQPQAARVGGRKRLTSAQKKLCYSEPEKLNRLGDGPAHSACRSLGSEREVRLLGEEEEELGECGEEEELGGERGEEGLVAARRKVFETRGRSQSASSLSKSNLKHLQHKALVAYMERKTGQKKVAEPQQPAPQVSGPPAPQRHSAEGKPSDRGPRLSQAYGSQGPKKKLHRPHSAGRILDSSSSSVRYAQFSSTQFNSAQSSSAHFNSAQSSWRDTPSPSQGKSASVESLLDQPEPPEFFRNRSISTPHAFQVHNYVDDPSSVDPMETSSLQKMADEEEASPMPGQAPLNPPEGQRVRVTAQRGKSLEELGVSKDAAAATPSVLSKSSEQLAQSRSRQGGPAARDKRSVSFFREGQEGTAQGVRQRQDDAHAEKTRLFKQNSAPQLGSEEEGAAPVTTRGPADSGRSASPASSRSSWARVRSGSPGAPRGSGPPVSEEPGTGEPAIPTCPGDRETDEREIKSTSSSSPVSSKLLPERKSSSSGLRTTPPVTSEEREWSVDEPSETASPSEADQEVVVSLSCGVTTDPSLWIFLPEPGSSSTEEDEEAPPPSGGTVAEGPSPPPAPAPQGSDPPTPADADASTEGQGQGEEAAEGEGEVPAEDEANTGEGGGEEGEGPGGPETQKTPEKTPSPDEPRWAELVEEVVGADQSLASVLYPLTNRKTALMLMEQLLSEDTLLMEEHYKKKQEQRQAADSSETGEDVKPPPPSSSSSSPSSSSPVGENPQPPEPPNAADVTEKKRMLVSRIRERLHALEATRGALQAEVGENGARGQAVEALVQQHCQPMELERYHLFIGDLERVVSLLLCLSARLARVQNALSAVNQHTDAEDKQSLDNRHRLLCKQRDDAKDLKDNLDRRERLVSTFLSRRLSAEQLQDYRRFVQTKASLLIRLKDLEEKQRLGDEQLEALLGSLPL